MSASGSSRKVANVSTVPSLEKPLLILPKKDKAPVLPSSLPNESTLVTDSVVDSDTYEMFRDTETIPNKAHAPMPPNPLSPRRMRVVMPWHATQRYTDRHDYHPTSDTTTV